MTFIPPNNKNAEQAVIGSVLISNVIDAIRDILTPEDFYETRLGKIFSFMLEMRKAGKSIDMLTLKHEMSGNVDDDELIECMEAPSTYQHVREYARIVAEKSYERKIINTCREMAQDQDPEMIRKITDLVNAKQALYNPATFNYDLRLGDVYDELKEPKKSQGYQTHIEEIDKVWWTMRPGEINVWGGATNVGKSLIMLNLMHRAAINGERCLFVGTEMSAIETIHRHLSIFTNIEPWKFRIPKLEPSELKAVNDAIAERMYKLPISILDVSEPSLDDIDRTISGVKPAIVFLDYLERFTMPKEDSLRLRIKEFMRRLKSIARHRNVVIHLAAQLNRMSYDDDKPPTMAQLSESSAIEKEADRVILFWCPTKRQPDFKSRKRLIEVVQAKNRHGKKGLTFEFILNEDNLSINTQGELNAHIGNDERRGEVVNPGGSLWPKGPSAGRARESSGGSVPDSETLQPSVRSHGLDRKDRLAGDAYQPEPEDFL